MIKKSIKKLNAEEREELLKILKLRFEKNMHRHKDYDWQKIEIKLQNNPEKLSILNAMEKTGGEPDVVAHDKENDQFIFYDCSKESPKGRRSLCYDREALDSRKKFKPENSVMDMAAEIGVELLSEEEYKHLQELENVDTKTSSWLKTPNEIRELGGAIFGDFRYGKVFVYHNGAESYYQSRGFRASLKI